MSEVVIPLLLQHILLPQKAQVEKDMFPVKKKRHSKAGVCVLYPDLEAAVRIL